MRMGLFEAMLENDHKIAVFILQHMHCPGCACGGPAATCLPPPMVNHPHMDNSYINNQTSLKSHSRLEILRNGADLLT
jgi:hypothetical protein